MTQDFVPVCLDRISTTLASWRVDGAVEQLQAMPFASALETSVDTPSQNPDSPGATVASGAFGEPS
jgi:hypothetical protein